jgi:hypothetical protein
MISLPPRAGRFELRSFWLVCTVILAGGILLIAWRLNIFFSIVVAVIAGAAFNSIVAVREPFARRVYHAWNRRLVRPLAKAAASLVLGVCFVIIFVATGALGSRLGLSRHALSTWERRTSLPFNAYKLPFASQGEIDVNTGWIRRYVHWAYRSGNAWAMSLIPFLWLLRLLSTEDRERMQANIYTLF